MGPVSSLCYIDNETGDFPKSHLAFAADARATMLGSLLFNASHKLHGIGIACRASARTGLTTVVCGILLLFENFLLSLSLRFLPGLQAGLSSFSHVPLTRRSEMVRCTGCIDGLLPVTLNADVV